ISLSLRVARVRPRLLCKQEVTGSIPVGSIRVESAPQAEVRSPRGPLEEATSARIRVVLAFIAARIPLDQCGSSGNRSVGGGPFEANPQGCSRLRLVGISVAGCHPPVG